MHLWKTERKTLILPCRVDYYCTTNLMPFFPLFRYYAAFPALSTQTAESLIHGTATNIQPPVNNVWAKKKHLLTAAATWSDEHDSGSSSRDSSGEVRHRSHLRFIHAVRLRKRNMTLIFAVNSLLQYSKSEQYVRDCDCQSNLSLLLCSWEMRCND